MLYRIYTEDKNRETVIVPTILKHFTGCTLTSATGYWKLQAEPSVIIEIICQPEDWPKIRVICENIRQINEQESVLIEEVKSPIFEINESGLQHVS